MVTVIGLQDLEEDEDGYGSIPWGGHAVGGVGCLLISCTHECRTRQAVFYGEARPEPYPEGSEGALLDAQRQAEIARLQRKQKRIRDARLRLPAQGSTATQDVEVEKAIEP